MPRLTWDATGERKYETGVRHGVLYLRDPDGSYPRGVAWNGLTQVTESPSGAEATPLYADDIKYLNLISAEEFSATIEAYTYPKEWEVLDGGAEIADGVLIGQQTRESFGLSYRTVVGNDVQGENYGYKIHLIYGGVASPSDKSYQTINDSPDAITFSWDIATTPENVTGFKPTATIVIDSTQVDADKLASFEEILYGGDSSEAKLPLPDEVASHFAAAG